MLCIAVPAATFIVVAGVMTAPSGDETTGPRDLLLRVGFSAREIAEIERGNAVARVLDTERREIAVIGAVRIYGSTGALAKRFHHAAYLKGNNAVLALGVFGQPPDPADLNALRFEEYDLQLGDCRPGHCRVRLSRSDITAFHRDVDWRGPGWPTQSASVWRHVLSAYAAGYRAAGPAALPVFVNKEEPLNVRAERQILIDRLQPMAPCGPTLFEYLRDPTGTPHSQVDELTYWTVEDFGVRPVIRVVHQAMIDAPGTAAPLAVVSDQIYAAHYLDAAISFTCALDAREDGKEAFILISVSRARTRSLTGLLRTMVRSTVLRRSREGMEKILLSAKHGLEGTTRPDP